MKLLTCYTETHKPFVPQFFRTLDQSDGLDVFIRQHPQECDDGAFMNEGWCLTTRRKFEFILEFLQSTPEDEILIFSDIDVQFFQPLTALAHEALREGVEIAFQDDHIGNACTGFFYFRNSAIVREFFTQLVAECHKYRDDQEAANQILMRGGIKYSILPHKYFSYGFFQTHWQGEATFPLPDDMVIHHANWTSGVDSKLALLQTVQNMVNGTTAAAAATAPPQKKKGPWPWSK